jgi:hypothetical protein
MAVLELEELVSVLARMTCVVAQVEWVFTVAHLVLCRLVLDVGWLMEGGRKVRIGLVSASVAFPSHEVIKSSQSITQHKPKHQFFEPEILPSESCNYANVCTSTTKYEFHSATPIRIRLQAKAQQEF